MARIRDQEVNGTIKSISLRESRSLPQYLMLQRTWLAGYAFLVALLLTASGFLALLLPFPAALETNDDAAMMMFSSGFLTGTPENVLVMMHPLLGGLLQLLFTIEPEVNWYSMQLYSARYVAITVTTWLFLRIQPSFFTLLVVVILFVLLETSMLITIQYTSTAIMLGAAGAVLILDGTFYRTDTEDSLFYVMIIGGIMLITWALMIRWQSFIVVIFFLFPLLIKGYFQNRRALIPVVMLLLVAVFLLLRTIDYAHHAEESENINYLNYIKNLEVLANDPLALTSESLDRSGWSANDYQLFRYWFGIDEKVYSREKIVTLANAAGANNGILQTLTILKGIVIKEISLIFIGFIIFLLVLVLLPAKKRFDFVLVSVLLCGFYFGLAMFARLPLRVFLPTLDFAILLVVYCLLTTPAEQFRKTGQSAKVILLASIAVAVILQLFILHGAINRNWRVASAYRLAVADLARHPDKLHVVIGPNFPYEGLPVWRNPVQDSHQNLLTTGWTADSPVYRKILQQWGIDSIVPALYERSDIVVVGAPLRSFSRFIADHYDEKVRFNDLENDYRVLKVFQVEKL